MRYNKTYKPPN